MVLCRSSCSIVINLITLRATLQSTANVVFAFFLLLIVNLYFINVQYWEIGFAIQKKWHGLNYFGVKSAELL